jgi:hypothetical protein
MKLISILIAAIICVVSSWVISRIEKKHYKTHQDKQIEKYFSFLNEEYGLEVTGFHNGGSLAHTKWENDNVIILVSFEYLDKPPLTINVADKKEIKTIPSYKRYADESWYASGKSEDNYRLASEWLKKAIDEKIIQLE